VSNTINEDGTPVLIEAVYYRHHCVYAEECDSIEEAVAFLYSGMDYGSLASVGVFVDGTPHVTEEFMEHPGRPPTAEEAENMLSSYANIEREPEPERELLQIEQGKS
jgi:hypothetical protein